MSLKERTLEVTEIEEMFQCRISTVKPFVLMLAPVFVLMKKNEKLVCVKAPFDFFTADELINLGRYETFYLPKSVKDTVRFQTVAKIHRALFTVKPGTLSRAPFETSNEVIKSVVALWGDHLAIEPFAAAIYADELCGGLDSEAMISGRDQQVVWHEVGVLLAGAMTLILVHLGWHNLERLKAFRMEVYRRTVNGERWTNPANEWELVACDLISLIEGKHRITVSWLSSVKSEWARKLTARMKRVAENPQTHRYPSLEYNPMEGFKNEAA
jgi:hypothetical protein